MKNNELKTLIEDIYKLINIKKEESILLVKILSSFTE